MKQLTMVFAAAAIFLATGCEKRPGQAEEADRYKTNIDGPTCVLIVRADENLLKDQKILSRQAKLSEASAERENRATYEDAGERDTTPAPTISPDAVPAPTDVSEPAPETGGERES